MAAEPCTGEHTWRIYSLAHNYTDEEDGMLVIEYDTICGSCGAAGATSHKLKLTNDDMEYIDTVWCNDFHKGGGY